AVAVARGRRHHHAQVGLHERLLGRLAVLDEALQLAAAAVGGRVGLLDVGQARQLGGGRVGGLDAARQRHLLVAGEERHAADLAQVALYVARLAVETPRGRRGLLRLLGGLARGGRRRCGGEVVVVAERCLGRVRGRVGLRAGLPLAAALGERFVGPAVPGV